MTNLDDKLRKALREQFGSDEFDDDRDTAVLDLVIDTFRGRNRWLTYIGIIGAVAFVAVAVLCVFRFFDAAETRDQIFWAVTFIACLIAVGISEIWFWMQVDRNALLRESKRIELQIARLASIARDKT